MPLDARFHIHHAAENFNVGDLKRELAAGTDPNKVNRYGPYAEYCGWTPLLILCRSWRYESKEDEAVACAAALIEAGANVNFRSDDMALRGFTPLLLAACRAMPRVVAMLIAAGADVASTGQAALKAALESCYSESCFKFPIRNAVRVVSMLIDAGVSARGKRLDKLVPDLARADDRIIAHLLRAGAEIPKNNKYVWCADTRAASRHAEGRPYLWNLSFAGSSWASFKAYERKCLESLTAIFAPKFPQLPEELIPTIVRYAFHPGMYASSGVPTLTPAQAERIFISLDLHPSSFSLDSPYRFMLDAMFRRGVDPEILNRRGSEFKWVPPPPEHHGRQPWPHELKCAYELHLSTVESLRRFHREEYRREYESRLLS